MIWKEPKLLPAGHLIIAAAYTSQVCQYPYKHNYYYCSNLDFFGPAIQQKSNMALMVSNGLQDVTIAKNSHTI